MHILYLDESGFESRSKYFVLAGLAVFEREIYWFSQDLDAIQHKYLPEASEPAEFHASPLHSDHPPPPFNALTKEQRRNLVAEVYGVIRTRYGIVFAEAIEKARFPSDDPYEKAFEDLVSRFDLFLRRLNATSNEAEQRGIIAVAQSGYREHLEVLGERFRGGGTRWGPLHTLAEVPFFLPSKNTRLLQLADFCANAVYGRYESGLTRNFDIIAPKFDREGSRIHGLVHLSSDQLCQCLGCLGRH